MSEQISIKHLDHAHLPAVIDLSVDIFCPNTEGQKKYHDPMCWAQDLEAGGLILGAYYGERLVGFQFARRASPTTLHLWLGGVLPEFQRRGIMTQLFSALADSARQRQYRELTVNTYHEKFPDMFRLLPHCGFELQREETVWKEGQEMTKSFWRKKIEPSA